MREKIDQKVNVIMSRSKPTIINWQNQDYRVNKIGYHHKVYDGRVLRHIFELTVQDQELWMRLNFNTYNLSWILEIIADGNPD
jgi:hypothetical protein